MSEPARHTPAPWVASFGPCGGYEVESPTGADSGGPFTVCSRSGAWGDGEHAAAVRAQIAADARLIEAAPELLQLCECAAERFEGSDNPAVERLYARLSAVIARVRAGAA